MIGESPANKAGLFESSEKEASYYKRNFPSTKAVFINIAISFCKSIVLEMSEFPSKNIVHITYFELYLFKILAYSGLFNSSSILQCLVFNKRSTVH